MTFLAFPYKLFEYSIAACYARCDIRCNNFFR